nr:MAG TPA: hypothetical protein [Bacteriophage sp.]
MPCSSIAFYLLSVIYYTIGVRLCQAFFQNFLRFFAIIIESAAVF